MFSFSADSSFHPDLLRLLSTSMASRPSLMSVLSQSAGVTKSLRLTFTPLPAPNFHHGPFFCSINSSSPSVSALTSRYVSIYLERLSVVLLVTEFTIHVWKQALTLGIRLGMGCHHRGPLALQLERPFSGFHLRSCQIPDHAQAPPYSEAWEPGTIGACRTP